MILSLSEGKIRLWSFTTTDHIQGAVKFEIGKLPIFGLILIVYHINLVQWP